MKKHSLLEIAFVLILVFGLFSSPVFAQGDTEAAKRTAEKTARALGWSDNTFPRQGAPGVSYEVNPYGAPGDSEIFAFVAVMNDAEAKSMLQTLEDNGMTRASFNGRDAIIMRQGDKICNPKEGTVLDVTFTIIEMLAKSIADQMETTYSNEPLCAESYGTIVWRCGPYVFGTQDQTGNGFEMEIANAIYNAAEDENLCGIEDTVVILAQTSDVAGTKRISHYQTLAQDVNRYFGQNAYGKVLFTYTFKDADGPTGNNDWYSVGGTTASYTATNTGPLNFMEEAVKTAFKGADFEDDVYVERAVIVHSGASNQRGAANGFSTACWWQKDSDYVEVDGLNGKVKMYIRNFVMVAEEDTVGDWSHEFGHSLYSKYPLFTDYYRISDRYNYKDNAARAYGKIWSWGLMGSGNYWGSPSGSSPTHMSSFTKESAGWLSYWDIGLNTSYSGTALENKKSGELIFRLDDPRSDDARDYYIIEQRDGSTYYGAPESGTNVHFVWYDTTNDHYVVNLLWPQKDGDKIANSTQGGRYVTSTLWEPGASYISPTAELNFTLESESFNPYESTFKITKYVPKNMTGAAASPQGAPAVNPPAGGTVTINTQSDFVPDVDLHAYDDFGNHVGLNYNTMEYETNIPGAIASGDLVNSEEWIYVPDGTNVRFELSAEKTRRFLLDNPEISQYASPKQTNVEYIKFDENGERETADYGVVEVDHTQRPEQIPSPDDSSLTYTADELPGVGNNSSCCCLPAFLVLVVSGFAAFRGKGQ